MRGTAPRTLRTRVALTAVAVLAVWVVVLTVGVNVVLRDRLAAEADDTLRARAQAAAATVVIGTDGSVAVRDGTDDTAVDVDTWILAGERVVEAPPGAAVLTVTALSMAGQGRTGRTVGGSGGSRWYAEPIVSGDTQVGTVVTVRSLAPYGDAERLVLVATAILGLLLLAGAYLALRAGVGLALRPVQRMTDQARRWSTDDVEHRFGVAARPTELRQLAITLDGVLDRLSAVLRRERFVSAEISHELRTPLTRMSADLDLLRRRPELTSSTRAALAEIADDVTELGSIVHTVMTAGQHSQRAGERCDALEVVRRLSPRWTPRPRVEIRSGPVVVGVSQAVLERALIPVLDNATRFARSAVTVRLDRLDGRAVIEIVDDGTGLGPMTPDDVFEPGRSGSDHPDRAGLGLALTRRLVTAADGTVAATSTPAGATFTIRLPAGPPIRSQVDPDASSAVPPQS